MTPQPPEIIAELANAHQGSYDIACALIDAAARAGADGVKFQRFTAEELVAPSHPRHGHFRGCELTDAEWASLVRRAREAGLKVWSDVFGVHSARAMQDVGVDGVKIHASDLANLPLLRAAASGRRPVLVGCGGATLLEIREAMTSLLEQGCPRVIPLHGFQAFPTSLQETHLARMRSLQDVLGVPVGVSDHVDGGSEWARLVPLLAAVMGAVVIEKHLTLDRAARGIDHHAALEPLELAWLVERVRELRTVWGSAVIQRGPEEQRYRLQMKKQLVAMVPLASGTPVMDSRVGYLRTESACAPLRMDRVLGRRTTRDMAPYEPMTLADVELRVAVLLIVRLHSARLPRKALLSIAGRPALRHLIERARLVTQADAVIVCTSRHPEDEPLAALAQEAKVACVRGSEDDVLGRMVQAGREADAQILVRVTGDDILLDPLHADRAIAWHRAQNADYTKIHGLPGGTECEVFSLWALEQMHRLAEDVSQTEYLSWYMDRPDLFEIAMLQADASVRRPYRLTLDTPDDARVVVPALEAVYDPDRPYQLTELLAWLDAHPQIAGLNAHIRPKLAREQVNTRLAMAVAR